MKTDYRKKARKDLTKWFFGIIKKEREKLSKEHPELPIEFIEDIINEAVDSMGRKMFNMRMI